MEMTLGSMFFYGGIIGLIVTILSAIIVGFVLGSGRRKLRKRMNNEYGANS